MCDAKDFYKDAVIFVTGATGFVGKTLLEKLLWSFPQIARIYMLIREKSGRTVAQRCQDFVQHKIFERLRTHFPERLEKLVYLKGNIECDDFGLCPTDRTQLCAHVQIIFHSAATVRFNERLKVAARVNAIGTWHLLELCKEMPKLKSFVYVSTAYCNPGRKFVDELIYPTLPPVNWKMFVDCTNKIPDAYFNSLANYIKGPHPNTYTFTKSIAEQIVNEYKHCIPIVIVRPSIVTAAHREPYPGWIDNIQGITGIMMEIGKGTISSILGDKDIICDIIPVDFVVNSLLLMAQKATLGRVYIANATSGVTNPITWARLGCLTLKWSRIYPTKRIMMYPNFKYRKSFLLHEIAVILLHYVPALLMDLLTLLRQKRKFVLPIAKKFRQACLAGRTFSLNEWIFKNRSRYYFEELLQNKALHQLSWNLEALDYDSYIREFVIGIQKYLHHEQFHESASRWRITRLYWIWTFLHVFVPLLTVYCLL
ncbi:putative fatty acyl-CoA reductase CG5065 [Rhagoletis pomonella]|uniref:putative fatty acyl-CoA reductase CG5065 n=1 Tax=Rhagoletis pomonella TaxID=28610 RepID=UPI00178283BC|nr:putative fatty acyl-CoA reductase CG5065 [Rhagoletis pomonella]